MLVLFDVIVEVPQVDSDQQMRHQVWQIGMDYLVDQCWEGGAIVQELQQCRLYHPKGPQHNHHYQVLGAGLYRMDVIRIKGHQE